MSIQHKEKLWRGSYIYILLISVFSGTGFQMVTPVLPLYTESLGLSLSIAGMLSGTIALTALLIRPFSGIIADHFDKKYLYMCAATIVVIAVAGLSFSKSIEMLFFFRILHGIGFSISSTVSMTLGSLFIPKSRMGEGISYMGLSFIIATLIGPNLGISIADIYSVPTAFQVSAILTAVPPLTMLLWKYSKHTSENRKFSLKWSSLFAREALLFSIVNGCFSFVAGIIVTFIVLYGKQEGLQQIGLYFMVNALTILFIRIVLGKLSDKMQLKYILYPCFILCISALFLLSLADQMIYVIVAAILFGLGQGIAQPALQAESFKAVDTKRRGVATSTYFVGMDVGQGLGPTIGGKVAEYAGYASTFAYSSMALVIGAGIYWLTNRIKKRKHGKISSS